MNQTTIWDNGREKSKFKGPEAGAYLEHWRNCKEASVVEGRKGREINRW